MEPVRYPEGVLRALMAACASHPDQRVMQVIVNALGPDPYYIEDSEALVLLTKYARDLR